MVGESFPGFDAPHLDEWHCKIYGEGPYGGYSVLVPISMFFKDFYVKWGLLCSCPMFFKDLYIYIVMV